MIISCDDVIINVIIISWRNLHGEAQGHDGRQLGGVVLPKEVLACLNIEKGDNLFLTEGPDGYRLTPYSPDFERQMNLVRKVMGERRNVLRELAK